MLKDRYCVYLPLYLLNFESAVIIPVLLFEKFSI